MISMDNGEVLLTAEEFAKKLGTGIKTARHVMSDKDGNYVVNVGKRKYVCWGRYQRHVLKED